MSPEDRGYAIGSAPELVEIHNSHARHERRNLQSSMSSKPSPTLPNGTACVQKQEDNDAFHYVSFVPVNGRLMELDGLRELPADHGPVPTDGSFWTEHFRRLIRKRVGLDRENSELENGNAATVSTANDIQPGDIRYNLMAVVPDKRVLLREKLNILRANMGTIHQTVHEMVTRCERENSGEEIKMESDIMTPLTSPMIPEGHDDESEVPFSALKEQVEKIKDSPLKVSVAQVVETGNGDQRLMQPCTTVAHTDITKPLYLAVAESAAPNSDLSCPAPLKSWSATSNTPVPSQWTPVYATSPSSMSGIPPRETHTPSTTTTFSPTPSPSSLTSATTSRSKYSTRSSTRLNTLASNSLANARNDCNNMLSDRISSHKGFSPEELLELAQQVHVAIRECEVQIREQEAKRKKYLVDDQRRRHDYSEFIHTFVHMLVETGQWSVLEQQHREKESRELKDRDSKDPISHNDQRFDSNLRARARRNVRRKNCRPVSDIRKIKHRTSANKKATVSHPILLQKINKGRPDTHILVIWDDPGQGVCHYMKKAHLQLLDSETFSAGARVAYRDRSRMWTGRIPTSFSEVEKICSAETAEVDLDFDGERQFLVMWDNTTEGACDYVSAELLNIVDDSEEIGRGTRVSMLWNQEEWFGQVPPVDQRIK